MKILSGQQLQEADRYTIEKGVSSNELMEKAGALVFREIHRRLKKRQVHIKIFCGIGNNGGDGLVIARLLIEEGYEVTVYVVNYSDKRSKDFLINYDRIKHVTRNWPVLLKSEADFPQLNQNDFLVDAIFGVGLNRPLVGWVAQLIRYLNASKAFVLAVDMPSGMFADQATKEKDTIVQADFTMTFQAPKLAFFLAGTGPHVGILKVLDIGMDKEYLDKLPGVGQLIQKPEARKLYRPRKKFTHKGTYGHALLIGGSHGKIGSICLSATSCMRAGAGMATVFTPKCGYPIVQQLLPEAMVITDREDDYLSALEFDLEPSVICFGVGVGKRQETLKAFENLLDRTNNPMVIDADGLNLLSENPDLLNKLPRGSVLTPHPKELERLIGAWKDDFQKLEMAREFAMKHQVVLVLKDAHTITLTAEETFVNNSGNPGMATAGSGDVLAGVITGLISQGYDSLAAAVFGVYLHGSAGDLAARKGSLQGILAGDIAANLGTAYLELLNGE